MFLSFTPTAIAQRLQKNFLIIHSNRNSVAVAKNASLFLPYATRFHGLRFSFSLTLFFLYYINKFINFINNRKKYNEIRT